MNFEFVPMCLCISPVNEALVLSLSANWREHLLGHRCELKEWCWFSEASEWGDWTMCLVTYLCLLDLLSPPWSPTYLLLYATRVEWFWSHSPLVSRDQRVSLYQGLKASQKLLYKWFLTPCYCSRALVVWSPALLSETCQRLQGILIYHRYL